MPARPPSYNGSCRCEEGKPERHLYAVETPLHDDLAVEQLRAQLDDEWFTRMQGWGNDAGDAS